MILAANQHLHFVDQALLFTWDFVGPDFVKVHAVRNLDI